MGLLMVLTTVEDTAQADALANALVAQRLVACAQVSSIGSVYRWQGEVVRAPEVRLLLKTTEARYDALEQALLELHPYDTPAIVALPAKRASAAFSAWVAEEATP